MRALSLVAVLLALAAQPARGAWGAKLAEWSSAGASAASAALPSGVDVVFQCDGDAYLQFGGSTVVATTSSPYYSGASRPLWKDRTAAGYNYVAALSVGAGLVTCRVWSYQ